MSLNDLLCDKCGAPGTELTIHGLFCPTCFAGYKHVVCDFCSDVNVHWSYPCKDFEAWKVGESDEGKLISGHSRGGWAACDVCKDLIEKDEWIELTLRVIERDTAMAALYEGATPDLMKQIQEIHVQVLMETYELFKLNRTGPVEPYDPEVDPR